MNTLLIIAGVIVSLIALAFFGGVLYFAARIFKFVFTNLKLPPLFANKLGGL